MADQPLEIQGYHVQLHDNLDGTFSITTTTLTGADDVTIEHEGLRMKLHPTGSVDQNGNKMYALVTA